jgi:hypothetical protein
MVKLIDWKDSLLANAPDPAIAVNVVSAVQQLFDVDAELLIRDLHEKALTAHLANYLRPYFPDWHVDSEYNRDGPEIKKVDGIIVVPDIIVHHRGMPDNLLVIEVKKSNTRIPDEEDIEKLHAYRESHLRYRHGLFLKLLVGHGAPGVSRILWV